MKRWHSWILLVLLLSPIIIVSIDSVVKAVSEPTQEQTGPVTRIYDDVSELISVRQQGGSTFSFEQRTTSRIPPFPTERSADAISAYSKKLLSLGAFSYELKSNGVKLHVFSGQAAVLGVGTLAEFSEVDLSQRVKKRSAFLFGLQEGTVVLIKTPDEKFCLLRIQSASTERLKFRWVYQPDGSAEFPRVPPLPGERVMEAPVISQSQKDRELFELCAAGPRHGNDAFSAALDALIDRGANINTASETGFTPLEEVALGGSLHAVRALVESGAVVDGSLALINAAVMGHIAVCRYLLEQGSDVNVRGPRGETPLAAALRSRRRDADIIELLRANGAGKDSVLLAADLGDMAMLRREILRKADLDVADGRGRTALHIAADSMHADICKALLVAGANRHATLRGKAITPFSVAAGKGALGCVDAFLRSEPAPAMKEKSQALSSAATRGQAGACRAILATSRTPADLIASSPQLSSVLRVATDDVIDVYAGAEFRIPLWAAARRGRADLVTQALDRGEDPELCSPVSDREPPLLLAVMYGKKNIVQLLLEKGALPNSMSKRNMRTALHEAAVGDDPDIVQLLLDNGAEVDSLAGDETALYRAVRRGRREITETLLAGGADPNILPERCDGKDGRKRVPLHQGTKDKKLQKILKKAGSK